MNGKYVIDEKTKSRAKTSQDLRKGRTGDTGMGELLNVPQKQMMKSITGRYEGPGDALERKKKVTPMGRDVVNFVADPINAIPMMAVGKAMKLTKADNRAIKINKAIKTVKRTSNASQVSEMAMKKKKS